MDLLMGTGKWMEKLIVNLGGKSVNNASNGKIKK